MRKTSHIIRSISWGAVLALGLEMAGVGSARAEDKAVHGLFTPKDYKFVYKAIQGGQTEITLSQLASQKAAFPGVREFAQRMVQDHQKANEELTRLATDKGAILPDANTKTSEKMAEELKNLSGADFDRAYMKDMVSDHQKTIKMFQKAAEYAEDGDLKSWAAKTLPTLADHLRMAHSVEGSLNGSKVAAR